MTYRVSFSALLVPVAMCSLALYANAQTTPTLDSQQQAFLTLINSYRSQNGLGPLKVSVSLQNSSQWMSNDLSSKNYFSHTDSLGRDPFTRMHAFGYPNAGAGENIAAGYSDAQSVLTGWQNACDPDSTGACTYAHRQNMLNASYVVIGIGRAYSASSTYGWYWTTDFGSYLDQTINPGPPAPNPLPTADSVTLNSGLGSSKMLTFKYSSPSGSGYLTYLYGVINGALSANSGCVFEYYAPSQTLYLFNDAGNGLAGVLTIGSTNTVSNSQCSISGSGFAATANGNQLSLSIPVVFKPTFTGSKTIYGYAIDRANQSSGWQTLGQLRN